MNTPFRLGSSRAYKGNLFAAPNGGVAVSAVADLEEYTYDYGPPHLSETEATERYRRATTSKESDTLVVLDNHDCGHWTVQEFKTATAREAYLRSKLQSIVAQFFNVFSK